jgi:hypothetical protein
VSNVKHNKSKSNTFFLLLSKTIVIMANLFFLLLMNVKELKIKIHLILVFNVRHLKMYNYYVKWSQFCKGL